MAPSRLKNGFVVADRSGRDRAQSLVDLGHCQIIASQIKKEKKNDVVPNM
jgi:hypothetical protein